MLVSIVSLYILYIRVISSVKPLFLWCFQTEKNTRSSALLSIYSVLSVLLSVFLSFSHIPQFRLKEINIIITSLADYLERKSFTLGTRILKVETVDTGTKQTGAKENGSQNNKQWITKKITYLTPWEMNIPEKLETKLMKPGVIDNVERSEN